MAIKKTVEIDVKVKTDETKKAEESFKGINKSLQDLKTNSKNALSDEGFKKVNAEIKNTVASTVSVKTQLRLLQDQMAANGDVGSAEFQKLAKEAGVLKDKMNNANQAIRTMSNDFPKLQLGVQAFGALGAGAQVAAGASQLLGSENEAVTKGIQRMMAIQSILNGVNAVANALSDETALGLKVRTILTNLQSKASGKLTAVTVIQSAVTGAAATAMKVLNAVMKANPVFLLIGAFAALAGAFAYFTSEEEKAEAMSEKVNNTYNDRLALLDKLGKAMARDNAQALKELQLNGASEEALHNQRVKNLDSEEKLRKSSAIAEKENVKGKQEVYRQALKEGNEELATSLKEEIAESRKRYRDLEGQHKDYVNNKKNENKEYDNKVKEDSEADKAKQTADYKASADKYKAFLQKKLSIQQEIEDIRLGLIADGEFKEIEILNVTAQRKRDALIADTSIGQEQKDTLLKLYDVRRQVDEQVIRDSYLQKEKDLALKVAEAKALALVPPPAPDFADMPDAVNVEIEAEILTQAELRQIRNLAREEEATAHAAAMQDKIDKSAGYFDAVSQSLSALDDLNSLLTDKAVKDAGTNEAAAEAARKKGFERSKKLQITMAVISGIQGVMSAFTAGSSMGPAGVVMGPLMAALAAVTAGVNIAKIKATSYGGGGGGSPSVPQSVPNPASFNVVGDSGTNQIAETLGQQNANPTKTYVVAGDVTSAQSLERNKIANASL
jgi:hypothetical protein